METIADGKPCLVQDRVAGVSRRQRVAFTVGEDLASNGKARQMIAAGVSFQLTSEQNPAYKFALINDGSSF